MVVLRTLQNRLVKLNAQNDTEWFTSGEVERGHSIHGNVMLNLSSHTLNSVSLMGGVVSDFLHSANIHKKGDKTCTAATVCSKSQQALPLTLCFSGCVLGMFVW